MRIRRITASDGQRFGVFNQGNGDYVASIDDTGTHYAPPSYQSLPSWDDETAERRLRDAVSDYEYRMEAK